MSKDMVQVEVRILGKEYVVGCPREHQSELLESARIVDAKMRDIRASGKVVGTERMAVMAALNIAHELVECQNQDRSELNARIKAMQAKIEAVLDGEDRQLKL